MTTATIGTRIASCGLIKAAMTVAMAARSGLSRHSSRIPISRNTTPNESTWPHRTESNHDTGLATTRAAPINPARRLPPSSRTIDQTNQPSATSLRIAGILIRSPMWPVAFPTDPTSHRT